MRKFPNLQYIDFQDPGHILTIYILKTELTQISSYGWHLGDTFSSEASLEALYVHFFSSGISSGPTRNPARKKECTQSASRDTSLEKVSTSLEKVSPGCHP